MRVGFERMTFPVIKQMRRTFLSLVETTVVHPRMPPALRVVMLVGFKMMTPPVIKQMRRTFLSLAAAATVGVKEI
jgi:hypothetical protein